PPWCLRTDPRPRCARFAVFCGVVTRRSVNPHGAHLGAQHAGAQNLKALSAPDFLVELRGLEPLTPTLPVWCATSCATAPRTAHTREPTSELTRARGWAAQSITTPRRHADGPQTPRFTGLRGDYGILEAVRTSNSHRRSRENP